ncbi:MAG: response regulator [Nitrospirae bacterium]|nr:response regulator [Nitrospirota bacterium]
MSTIDVVKKVLIVESLKSLLEQEKNILSNRSLQIFTAASGEEALAIHKNEKVDLIVSRLDMPGTSGDSLCSLIRKDDTLKKVSFIMVCDNTKRDLERCQKCGANSYVTRPVDPEVFLEKVSQLIDILKRTGIRVLIKVSVKGDLGNQPFFCTSVNISASGILLEVDRAISRGAKITCSFFIPGSDSISVDGEIMRVVDIAPNTFHWGVKFLNLRKDHKTAIEAFVKKKT